MVSEAQDTTGRLIEASKEFLDAFIGWEAATDLNWGGGTSSSDPTASLGDQIQELAEHARSNRERNDELRELLLQVTHRLATRGFVAEADIG